MAVSQRFAEELLRQPETGMGWQLVEVRHDLSRVERVVVLNTSMVTGSLNRDTRVVREGDVGSRLSEARALLESDSPRVTLRVLSRAQAVKEGVVERAYFAAGIGPASDAPTELSELQERFLRFSAFANDRRVLADGSVVAGTFVTPYEDGIKVKTGREAVARYALPNADPAVYRFHLLPPRQVRIRRGMVQPANGQPGGGAEVIFEDAAPAGTCYHKDQIPPV